MSVAWTIVTIEKNDLAIAATLCSAFIIVNFESTYYEMGEELSGTDVIIC
jgi:hypothetical protein